MGVQEAGAALEREIVDAVKRANVGKRGSQRHRERTEHAKDGSEQTLPSPQALAFFLATNPIRFDAVRSWMMQTGLVAVQVLPVQ